MATDAIIANAWEPTLVGPVCFQPKCDSTIYVERVDKAGFGLTNDDDDVVVVLNENYSFLITTYDHYHCFILFPRLEVIGRQDSSSRK